MSDAGHVLRADSYRWAERWEAPAEPVNVFVSPPFADFTRRPEALLQLFMKQIIRKSDDALSLARLLGPNKRRTAAGER